jgi:FKBP-type peptidyl-prolyl cis-trans isomerase
MRKNIIIILLSIITISFFASCNKSRTYAQRLGDEKKAIELFIDKNDIKVLKEYPKDSVFNANEFYFDTSTGVYYNVIDSGDGRRIKQGEKVYIRFKGLRYLSSSDTSSYSNIPSPSQPEILTYGNKESYVSAGWIVPLKNIGHLGKVKLIVPFNLGLSSDQQAYKTAYYEELIFRFEE